MAKSPLRSWFWKITRLILVLLLVTGLVDVLVGVARHGATLFRPDKSAKEILDSKLFIFGPPPNPSDTVFDHPYEFLRDDPDIVNKPIVKETLLLTVTPEAIFARYDVYLPKDHPLFEVVQAGGAFSASSLVTHVLGSVRVNSDPLQFYLAETSVAADDPNAHFYITSYSVKPTVRDYWVRIEYPYEQINLRFEKREVLVQTERAQVWSFYKNPLPYSKTSELTIFDRATNPDSFDLQVHFPEGTPIEPPAPASLGALLSRSVDPPGLGTILYGLLGALPFLWFLYWTQKYDFKEQQPGFRLKVEAIQVYLALHFAYYFFFALDDLIHEWGNPAINALQYVQRHTITVFVLPGHFHDVLLPLMVLFVCIWPSMVGRWEQRRKVVSSERRRALIGQVLFVLTLIALIVWAGIRINKVTEVGFASMSVMVFYSAFVSVLLLGLLGACAWLAFEVFDRRRAGAALLIFLLIVILLAVWTLWQLTITRNSPRIWTANGIVSDVVFIVTAFVLISSFARLTYGAAATQPVSRVWKHWSHQKRWLVILAISIVSVSTRFWPANYWRLITLANELMGLFLLVLVWILVDFLKYKSKHSHWLNLPQSTRWAGILLSLVVFYSSTTRWNYLPIEFMVGFILLDKWFLPTKRYDRSLFAEIKGQLPQIIQKIIDFNDAEKTRESLKKELLSKVGKGELTHKQYLQKLKGQSKAVDDLKKELTIKEHFAKRVVLAFGPTDSAWRNGKKAALYSLFFSAPWTVLFLRNIVLAEAFGGSYLILDVVSSIIFFELKWISYGFILGYFYPYIKGDNGIQKGLSLFLTVITPSLVWTALANPLNAARWFSFGFWVLQIFVHTMLLGLVAGDYETLRQADFRWKQLLEIHRVGALSAWASSVFIAVGAAVSALITSGGAQLIASVIKFTAENFKVPTGKY